MNEQCPNIDHVDAYYDGELPAAEAARLEEHFRVCPACAERLGRTREIGGAFEAFARSEGMSLMAKERLRREIAGAVDRGSARFAWEMMGVAASVLVAATVWLATLPASASAGSGAAGGWEHAAATGGRSIEALADSRQRDVRFASWVVSGLTTSGDESGAVPPRQERQ